MANNLQLLVRQKLAQYQQQLSVYTQIVQVLGIQEDAEQSLQKLSSGINEYANNIRKLNEGDSTGRTWQQLSFDDFNEVMSLLAAVIKQSLSSRITKLNARAFGRRVYDRIRRATTGHQRKGRLMCNTLRGIIEELMRDDAGDAEKYAALFNYACCERQKGYCKGDKKAPIVTQASIDVFYDGRTADVIRKAYERGAFGTNVETLGQYAQKTGQKSSNLQKRQASEVKNLLRSFVMSTSQNARTKLQNTWKVSADEMKETASMFRAQFPQNVVDQKLVKYIAEAAQPNANAINELRRVRNALKARVGGDKSIAKKVRGDLLSLKHKGKALTKEQVRLFLGDSFEPGFQRPEYNNSKSKGMIFFKLELKSNQRKNASYDYWYVKIEDSCAALSTVADLFDYEQVKHAGGAITKIGLKQGKIPSAFRRSEKTFRDETLQLISLDNPGPDHKYGLVGKQVEDYDDVVERKLKNDKHGSEIVVKPEDVPSTPTALRSKLQDIRRDLQLKHGGVFILPVTPGGREDDMIMRLHEQGLGRASSHQKLFPGAGEARILCLNDTGGFSPPNMTGRKLIKPSLARREEMIQRLQNSIPTSVGITTLSSRARRRIAEQGVKGRGPLGIAPSDAQVRGLVKGIGLVWWPILVVCITGVFTGVQTARGADRSVISLSWWGLGVSAALHLLFSGNNALDRESILGAPQDKTARKRMFDVTQKKANSRFVLTMGVMCVFLAALRAGHGPLSGPTRVAGIVLAVASVLGFVLFLREGLSVPKFKQTYKSVIQEQIYAERVRDARERESKRLAATRLQAAMRGVVTRRATAAQGAAATPLPRTQSADTSNTFKVQTSSGTINIKWSDLSSIQTSRSQSTGNADRVRRKSQALQALSLKKNATVPQIKQKLKEMFPQRAKYIDQLR